MPRTALRDGPPDNDRREAVGRTRRSRRWWWWAAVPVVGVVAALLVSQAVSASRERAEVAAAEERERAEIAALADVEGLLRTVEHPTEDGWAGESDELVGAPRAGSAIVSASTSDTHAITLTGRDVDSGSTLWTVELVGPRPDLPPETEHAFVPCEAVPEAPGPRLPDRATHVACVVSDGGIVATDGTVAAAGPTTRLVVVDAADGTVTLDQEDAGPADTFTTSPTDALLSGLVDGVLHVRALSLADGTERWSVTVPATEDSGTSPDVLTSALLDDTTLAVAYGSAVTLVSTDGRVLRTAEGQAAAPADDEVMSGPTLSRSLGAAVLDDSRGPTVLSAASELGLAGSVLPTPVDDGSVPGLVLTRMPWATAWDAGDGSERWAATLVEPRSAIVLRGRVHLTTSDAIVTLDGATGEELWRVPAPLATSQTDGHHLYVLVPHDDTTAPQFDLVALDVTDGAEAWRVPLPEQTLATVVGDRLALVTFEGWGDVAEVRVLR